MEVPEAQRKPLVRSVIDAVGGTVPATLALTLGPGATFGAFTPGADREYVATTSASVISTAGDAALTTDGGTLSNGAFALAEPLRVEELAKRVGMSPSALHLHFKHVTTLSPLQYQKRLRLQEARRLILNEALDAASAAFRVGYESPSQFSREYRRLFGQPPQRDLALLRTASQPVYGERRAVS